MKLLTAEQVADILTIPKVSVYELCRTKRLPHIRVGRLVRIPEEDLRAWIDSGGSPLPNSDEGASYKSPEPPRSLEPSRR